MKDAITLYQDFLPTRLRQHERIRGTRITCIPSAKLCRAPCVRTQRLRADAPRDPGWPHRRQLSQIGDVQAICPFSMITLQYQNSPSRIFCPVQL